MSQGKPCPWPFPLTVENVRTAQDVLSRPVAGQWTSPHNKARDMRIRAIIEEEVHRRTAAYRLVSPPKSQHLDPDFEIGDDSTSGWMCDFLGGRRLRYDGFTGQSELCYYSEFVFRYGPAEGTCRWKNTTGHEYTICNGKPSGGSIKFLEDLQVQYPNNVVIFSAKVFFKRKV